MKRLGPRSLPCDFRDVVGHRGIIYRGGIAFDPVDCRGAAGGGGDAVDSAQCRGLHGGAGGAAYRAGGSFDHGLVGNDVGRAAGVDHADRHNRRLGWIEIAGDDLLEIHYGFTRRDDGIDAQMRECGVAAFADETLP